MEVLFFMAIDFRKHIASVKDFPNKGITFRDITPILQDGELYRAATHELAEYAKSRGAEVIVGPEARGFIVGCPVATELGVGFIPARIEHPRIIYPINRAISVAKTGNFGIFPPNITETWSKRLIHP